MSDSRAPQFPPIPEPTRDVDSLLRTVRALRQTVEILIGHRSPAENAALLRRHLTDGTIPPDSP